MSAVIDARVSTADGCQEVENQLAELRRFAATHGWEVVVEYIDHESESCTELNSARVRGKRSGRPAGRPRVSIDAERVLILRDENKLSWPAIGRQMHAGATRYGGLTRTRRAGAALMSVEPGCDSVGQSRSRVALYLWVSTADQNPELQLRELSDYAVRQGWDVVGTYEDTISGSKATRPALIGLLTDAGSNKFDCVAAWKLDRFGRSLVGCLNHIQELEERGIRFVAVSQNPDTDQRNPASRFLLHVLAAAAEFERSLILERTKAGRMRYKQDCEKGRVGKTIHSRSGKNLPPNRPQGVFGRDEIHSLRRRGCSLRQIAQKLGIGLGTVTRTLQSAAKVINRTT